MIKVGLVENNHVSRAKYLQGCTLPTFFMEDYSVLGFVVENLKSAKDIIVKSGFMIKEEGGRVQIVLDQHGQLQQLTRLLSAQGIQANFSDIADTMYQA